jgi:acyl-coenzyme A thioesterase PaaI-like protein
MSREGPFWDVMEGRKPPPPAAVTLGFKLLEIDPERGTISVQFAAKPEFLNPMGVVQGELVATATATARIVKRSDEVTK